MLTSLMILTVLAGSVVQPHANGDKPSLFVMNLKARGGVSQDTANLMTATLLTGFKHADVFGRIAGSDEMEAMLSLEARKQLVDCDSVSCAAEIGRALDADYVALGDIGSVGQSTVVNLRLMDLKKGAVVGSASRSVTGNDPGVLLPQLEPLVMELLGVVPPQPAAAPKPGPRINVEASPEKKTGSASANVSVSRDDAPAGIPWLSIASLGAVVATAGGLVVALGLLAGPSALLATGLVSMADWGGLAQVAPVVGLGAGMLVLVAAAVGWLASVGLSVAGALVDRAPFFLQPWPLAAVVTAAVVALVPALVVMSFVTVLLSGPNASNNNSSLSEGRAAAAGYFFFAAVALVPMALVSAVATVALGATHAGGALLHALLDDKDGEDGADDDETDPPSRK